MASSPHSGPYLAAEGETWVTMAHYEELLAERDRLFEQLEALQREVESYEALCHRCDSSIGIQQALERGKENWCDVCWDTPIIRRRASTPASTPDAQKGGTDA